MTAYFDSQKNLSPSYDLKLNNSRTLRIHQNDSTLLFKLKNETVQDAFIEKWYSNKKISVEFHLSDHGYKVGRILISNVGTYFSNSQPMKNNSNPCELQDSEIKKISQVINSSEYGLAFIDSSCSALKPMQKMNLLKLRQQINPEASEGKSFLQCLNTLSATQKNPKKKDQINDLRASIIATMRREALGSSALKISCVPMQSNNSAASCKPNEGIITFPLKGSELAINKSEAVKTYLHELVHHTHPLGLVQSYEESLADYVAGSCTNESEMNESERKFLSLDESTIETAKNIGTMPVEIKKAAETLAPQKVNIEALDSLKQVAENTTVKNATSLNQGFESLTTGPARSFSQLTNQIAAVFIKNAEASNTTGSTKNDLSPTTSNPKSRAPASDSIASNLNIGGSNLNGATTKRSPSTTEQLVEEIIIPTADGNKYSYSKIISEAKGTNQTIDQARDKATNIPLNISSNALEPKDFATSSALGVAAISKVSLSNAPVGKSLSGGSGGNNSGSTERNIGGVAFKATNILGADYNKYRSQIKEKLFKKMVEDAGILITKDGSLLSKPKNVTATYFDDGSALIYRGL
jgi:hypothetical protein